MLSEQGLHKLESLGTIENIVRLGHFHGRDDAFYQKKYSAKLWAMDGMDFSKGAKADILFDKDTNSYPFSKGRLIPFLTTKYPESVLYIDKNGGILVTCDSIKNWIKSDRFFSVETANDFSKSGVFGRVKIDDVWLNAMQPQNSDLENLLSIDFKHLVSAHGPVIKNEGYQLVKESIENLETQETKIGGTLFASLKEMFHEMVEKKNADLISKYYHPDFLLYTNGKEMTYSEMDALHKDIYKTSIQYKVEYDEETIVEEKDRIAGRVYITTKRQNEEARKIEVFLIGKYVDGKIHRIWELTYPDWSNLPAFSDKKDPSL